MNQRQLTSVLFGVECIILTACGGTPAEARRVALDDESFAHAITVDLPGPLTREGEKRWREAASTPSILPVLSPMYGRLRGFGPEALLRILKQYNAIEFFDLPQFGGPPITYFRYATGGLGGLFEMRDNVEISLRVAHREHVAVTYSNCYDINPMGMGKTRVCAFTFSYHIASDIPATHISLEGQGKSQAILDPRTGQWQRAEYSLSEPSTSELLDAIAKVLPATNPAVVQSSGASDSGDGAPQAGSTPSSDGTRAGASTPRAANTPAGQWHTFLNSFDAAVRSRDWKRVGPLMADQVKYMDLEDKLASSSVFNRLNQDEAATDKLLAIVHRGEMKVFPYSDGSGESRMLFLKPCSARFTWTQLTAAWKLDVYMYDRGLDTRTVVGEMARPAMDAQATRWLIRGGWIASSFLGTCLSLRASSGSWFA